MEDEGRPESARVQSGGVMFRLLARSASWIWGGGLVLGEPTEGA